jgi:hypothetical protein
MGARPALRSLTAACAAALVACGGRNGGRTPLLPGMAAPPVLAASSPSAVRASWVFDGQDLLRCRNSAIELRHLAARFGSALELVAVAVDADSADVASFLRVQRVHVPVRYVSGAGSNVLTTIQRPALYLARGARIEAVYPGIPLDDPVSIHHRDVESRVASLLGRSGAVLDRPSTITTGAEQ